MASKPVIRFAQNRGSSATNDDTSGGVPTGFGAPRALLTFTTAWNGLRTKFVPWAEIRTSAPSDLAAGASITAQPVNDPGSPSADALTSDVSKAALGLADGTGRRAAPACFAIAAFSNNRGALGGQGLAEVRLPGPKG